MVFGKRKVMKKPLNGFMNKSMNKKERGILPTIVRLTARKLWPIFC